MVSTLAAGRSRAANIGSRRQIIQKLRSLAALGSANDPWQNNFLSIVGVLVWRATIRDRSNSSGINKVRCDIYIEQRER
jgi:hypothetical protein